MLLNETREKSCSKEKSLNGRDRAYDYSCRPLFAAGVNYGIEDSSEISYARFFISLEEYYLSYRIPVEAARAPPVFR